MAYVPTFDVTALLNTIMPLVMLFVVFFLVIYLLRAFAK